MGLDKPLYTEGGPISLTSPVTLHLLRPLRRVNGLFQRRQELCHLLLHLNLNRNSHLLQLGSHSISLLNGNGPHF